MPRKITFNSHDINTGNVSFTVTDSSVAPANKTHIVNGISTASKQEFLDGVKAYLDAFNAGVTSKRPAAPSEVSSISGESIAGE